MVPSKYAAAAHEAARIVETQSSHCECLVPANAIVCEFLLQVRRQRLQACSEVTDNTAMQMKRAADSMRTHPFRVYDFASATGVKGCGPAIAKIICEHLFAAYPPAPPGEEELEAEQQQAAAMRAAAAAERKRKRAAANAPPALPPGMAGAVPAAAATGTLAAAAAGPAAAARAGAGAAAVPAEEEGAEQGGTQAGTRGKREGREYIPKLRSAPFAFLICMLQAQKGPARKQHLSKAEVVDLAEASGLSDRSIKGDAASARQLGDGRKFQFDGWNSFRSSLLNKGLAHEWSNPKKVSLTPQGFALAERLYRDGVARGVVEPIAGIAAAGPLLFQLDSPAVTEGAAAAAAAAGVPPAALPSVALQAGRRQPAPPHMPAGRRSSAGAAGTALAGALWMALAAGPAAEQDPLSLGLAERLQQQQQQQQQPAAAAARDAGGGGAAASFSSAAAPAAPAAAPAAEEVIDLLSEGDSPPPRRPAALPLERPGPQPARRPALASRAAPTAAVPPRSVLPAGVSELHVCSLTMMGHSDKKARLVLEQSVDEWGRLDMGLAREMAEHWDPTDDEDDDADPEADLRSFPDSIGDWPQPLVQPAAAAAGGAAQRAAVPEAAPSGAAPRAAMPTAAAAGGLAAAVGKPPARQPTRGAKGAPSSLAALQRQDSLPGQQQRQAAAGGHIRASSRQQPESRQGSQQSQRYVESQEAAGQYSEDDFMAQMDARLRGEPGPASLPAAAAAAVSGAATGSAGDAPAAGAACIELRPQDVRLPPLAAGERFGDAYEVLMVVDSREQVQRMRGERGAAMSGRDSLAQHLEALRGMGVLVVDRTLPIGDVLWIARARRAPHLEYVLDYVLERKSCSDLVSSIMQKGRYERQKYHLKRCGLRHVYYLLEGDPDRLPSEQEQKMVRTSVATTEVQDGFRVLRSSGHAGTFRLYAQLTRHIQDWYRDLQGPSTAGCLPTFGGWVEAVKECGEGNTTLHDLWGSMLLTLPCLGARYVQAVLEQYPTPLHLYRAYQDRIAAAQQQGLDPHRAAEGLLTGLKCSGGKNGLGPERSKSVYQLLFRRRTP